jgi:hypothetical protein
MVFKKLTFILAKKATMDSFVLFSTLWIAQLFLVLGYNNILGRRNTEINARFDKLEREQSYLRNRIHHLMISEEEDISADADADADAEEDHDE